MHDGPPQECLQWRHICITCCVDRAMFRYLCLHSSPPPICYPLPPQTACNYAQDRLGYVGQQKQVAKTTHTKHTDTNKEPP